jgi:hypothetical protein
LRAGERLRSWKRLRARRWPLAAAGVALRFTFLGPGLTILGVLGLVVLDLALLMHERASGIWLILFSPVFCMILLAMLRGVRATADLARRAAADAASAMLRDRRCPGCDYDLSGAPSEPDGRVACPECAAAWLAVRVGSGPPPAARVEVVREQV